LKIKAVIFDLDGVIFDSWPVTIKVVRGIKADLGETIDDEFIAKSWGLVGHKWSKILFSNSPPELVHRRWAEEERKIKIPLCPGVKEVLFWLKTWDFRAGVITNRRAGYLLSKIIEDNQLDLAGNFDFIQTVKARGPDFGTYNNRKLHPNHFFSIFTKPDARSFRIIRWFLKNRGIGKENVLFVGDTVGADLTLARRVGIEFLGVLTGPVDTREKWRDWGGLDEKHVLKSVIELPRWLSRCQKEELEGKI
jgi:phosphoglycolate phosphatase-like HAD superfamily hydrolase